MASTNNRKFDRKILTSDTVPENDPEQDPDCLVRLMKPHVVLFGFHGTIAPVDWEDRCIFSYVRSNLQRYLTRNWSTNGELYRLIEMLKSQSFDEHFVYETALAPLIIAFDGSNSNWEMVLDSVYQFVMWQLNRFRISKEALCLVRMCWIEGYALQAIQTIIYDDVMPAMKRFKSNGIKLGMFTTMSQDLARICLTSTTVGNITELIDYFFDTESVGSRRDGTTYNNLANSMSIDKSKIVFLCDYGQDVKNAVDSGIQAAIVIRPGNRKTRTYYLVRFPSTRSLENIEFV